jgi:hypothetical protein
MQRICQLGIIRNNQLVFNSLKRLRANEQPTRLPFILHDPLPCLLKFARQEAGKEKPPSFLPGDEPGKYKLRTTFSPGGQVWHRR